MMIDGTAKAVHSSVRIDPKYTHYAPYGCGRDSYIITNNGGFLPSEGMMNPHTGFVARSLPT